jgi:nitrogen fixation protein NifB
MKYGQLRIVLINGTDNANTKIKSSANCLFRQRSPAEIPLPGFYHLRTGEIAAPAVEGEHMATSCKQKNIQGHPCFGGNHHKNGRMHLAVAPRCNIKCGYCTRRHDCANESRPGVTSRLLTPSEAIQKVRDVMASEILGPVIKVIGIAGPGDPLANGETFETFRLVEKEFPHLIKCMSTNGLLLPEKMELLEELNLCSLTVTVNALDPDVGALIYSHIIYHGKRYGGKEAAEILIANQLEGIKMAAERGITVKVNSVFIPGVNETQMPLLSNTVKKLGASVMNIMPLIPQADFAHVVPPTEAELEEVRKSNEKVIGQFKHCRQCRADAVGLIGQDVKFAEVGCETGNVKR